MEWQLWRWFCCGRHNINVRLQTTITIQGLIGAKTFPPNYELPGHIQASIQKEGVVESAGLFWLRTTTASTGQLYYEGDAHPLNHHMTGSYGHVIITHRSFGSYSACSFCRSSIRKIFLALNQIRLGSPNLLPR
jgi:hypothetical protein